MKFGKEEKKSDKKGCGTCGQGQHNFKDYLAQQQKAIEEAEKRKSKSEDCPYLDVCTFRMLPEVGAMICLDQEGERGSPVWQEHLRQGHMWQKCRQYVDQLRAEKGMLPKDLKSFLKKQPKKK